MATPAPPALADMHREPPPDRLRLGNCPGTGTQSGPPRSPRHLTPARKRCITLLINLPRRLAMTMPTVLLPRAPPRPPRSRLRLPARERRRLTLARPPRLLQGPLELPDPSPQPLILARQPKDLVPQMLFSTDNAEHNASSRPHSSTGSAGSTSTPDAARQPRHHLRPRLHNPAEPLNQSLKKPSKRPKNTPSSWREKRRSTKKN